MATERPKLQIHTSAIPNSGITHARKRFRFQAGLSFQDRLLRNSCLACAVLLGILALGNLQQPWARKASQGIQQALTMKVDLDESLGRLSFVERMMPESARVFFNLSSKPEFHRPVEAELTHAYSEDQPWLMFASEADASVYSVADGVVSAVTSLSDGTYGVLIDHGNSLESVCAGLKTALVQSGDQVLRGGEIGAAAGSIYFEFRENAAAIDPSGRMGL